MHSARRRLALERGDNHASGAATLRVGNDDQRAQQTDVTERLQADRANGHAVRLRQHIIRESWPQGEERQRRFGANERADEVAEVTRWTVPTASVPPDDARDRES